MGRTKRKRTRKNRSSCHQSLNHDPAIIGLLQFMSKNGWTNDTTLGLRCFEDTGRGLSSRKAFRPQDTLIEIPYNLMVTYSTIKALMSCPQMFKTGAKLKIHDLLALFLLLERHKDTESGWASYIGSLPQNPPPLPCLLPLSQIELLPVEVRSSAKKSRNFLEESWQRVEKSIRSEWCRLNDGVLNFSSFAWGFVLVNTRAVYVDPVAVKGLDSEVVSPWIVADEPCMALCPFLDMFNHHHDARTESKLVSSEEQTVFRLTTLTAIRKHDQIFISYGSHDNLKLLTEYGFFIPGNSQDSLEFEAREIIDVLGLKMEKHQYKFIVEHELDKRSELYVDNNGASFNLKGFLYVAHYGSDIKNFATTIYSDSYSVDFRRVVKKSCEQLLEHKRGLFMREQDMWATVSLDLNPVETLISNYLSYRLEFIKCISNKLC